MVEGYKPQDFSFFHRGWKISTTREEALRRWNSAKETKRRMVERLETLARESYKEKTGEYPEGVEVW